MLITIEEEEEVEEVVFTRDNREVRAFLQGALSTLREGYFQDRHACAGRYPSATCYQ